MSEEFVFPAEYLKSPRIEHTKKLAADWKKRGYKGRPTRIRVPNGWCREYFELAWTGAAEKADKIMEEFENAGLVPVRPIPDTDDAIAKETLREAVTIALHPGVSIKDKLSAINTCLTFTKMKPVTKAQIDVKRPEDWLTEAIAASKDAEQ